MVTNNFNYFLNGASGSDTTLGNGGFMSKPTGTVYDVDGNAINDLYLCRKINAGGSGVGNNLAVALGLFTLKGLYLQTWSGTVNYSDHISVTYRDSICPATQ